MNSRIAPRTETPEHDIEIFYLNGLSADLKLWLHGIEPLKNIDLERVYLWRHVHSRELQRCSGFNIREYDDFGRRKMSAERGHDAAIKFLNALITDLEAILKDKEPNEPITIERVGEMRGHIHNLEQCRTRGIMY